MKAPLEITAGLFPFRALPRTRSVAPGSSAGFTLLELLIATVVFALVLAAINGVFYGALRLRNKSTASIEQSLPMQHALSVMKRDLSNLVPGGMLAGGLQTTPSINNLPGQISPDFYTATGLIDETSPWSEVQRVSYLLADSPTNRSGGSDLIRAVSRNLLPPSLRDTPSQQWLMGGVQGLTFAYYDGTQWRDSWDAAASDPTTGRTNLLPWAIKVQIRLVSGENGLPLASDGPVELVVPVVTQARTNTAQASSGGAS
jgi:general secretion pathway protein J